jgi:hypothetical protein
VIIGYGEITFILSKCEEILHMQKYNHEEKSSSLKFSISFQVVKFISNVVNALCYNNDEDYMIFLSYKMFFH